MSFLVFFKNLLKNLGPKTTETRRNTRPRFNVFPCIGESITFFKISFFSVSSIITYDSYCPLTFRIVSKNLLNQMSNRFWKIDKKLQ